MPSSRPYLRIHVVKQPHASLIVVSRACKPRLKLSTLPNEVDPLDTSCCHSLPA
jgi:hypothetical protein